MSRSAAEVIASHLRPGGRIAVADGAGMPMSLAAPLAEAAAGVGDISLLLGWCLDRPVDLEAGNPFRDIRTIMGGFALRSPVEAGLVRYVPTRLSAVPSLLTGPLRPDVLMVSLAPGQSGWVWGTEVSWMQALVDAGIPVVAEVNDGLPRCSRLAELPRSRVEVVAEVTRPPLDFPAVPSDEVSVTIARQVLPWLTPGCSVQYGPGPIADAVLDLVEHPLRLRSGMLTDAAVRLAERGLLSGTPSAAYVAGTAPLYEWCDGVGIVDRVEKTHALPSVEESPMVTLNMALEVDVYGQVNVQSADGREIGGIGGHPDFSRVGAVSPGGLSIVAVPTCRGSRSTLRSRLTGPVSTPRFDVDVVVTEHGSVDLRGLCDTERVTAVSSLWPD